MYDSTADVGDDEDKYVTITTPEGFTFFERRDEKEYEEFLDYVLNGVGVEMRDKAKDLWTHFDKEKRIRTGENLKMIARLEKVHPGAVSLLNGFYGIRNFARYSEQMLIDQCEKHGNTDNPYGVVVGAIADIEGAYRDSTRLGAAFRQLKTETPYDMRVVEASDSIDLVRQLSRLHKLYGQKQKFSFMIIRGHGTPESIVLSDSLSQTMKGLGSISLGNRLAAAEKWFVDRPLIVLQSCSTGVDDGIAQKISTEIHAMVIAPDEDGGLKKYTVGYKDGHLRIRPEYAVAIDPGYSFETRPVRAKMYVDGKLIPEDDPQYVEYFEESADE